VTAAGPEAGPRLDVLFESTPGVPDTAAERRYGAALRFPGAHHLVANFVATVDGVVSLGPQGDGGVSAIGAKSAADRWLMALLRAAADAVVIGAGTLRATAGHQWTAARLAPDSSDDLAAYRTALGRPAAAAPLVIVTASGRLPQHAALLRPATDVVFITTDAGAGQLAADFPQWPRIILEGRDRIDGARIAGALHGQLGARTVLCEGGPTLFGALLGSGSAHELFVTIAPRLAGRTAKQARLGVVAGWAAGEADLRGCELVSMRRAGDHLLLRYRITR
jgi:riboflavin biosynthesis pyrimidine reductase